MVLRREILKAFGLLGASTALLQSNPLQALQAIADKQHVARDYKGLVCIMLNGGNDAFNMVFPDKAHPEYHNYLHTRQTLAVPNYVNNPQYLANKGDVRYSKQLLPIMLRDLAGQQHALNFHPGMEGLHALTVDKQVAVIANTGVLIEPGNRDEFKHNRKRKPAFLFAHNQQRKAVYSGIGDNNVTTGWAGNMTELASLKYDSKGGLKQGGISAVLPMGISFHGTNQWLRGQDSMGAVLAPGKPGKIIGLDEKGNKRQQARTTTVQALQSLPSDDVLIHVMRGKLTSAQDLATVLTQLWAKNSKALAKIDAFFDEDKLSRQLAAVAQTILLRESLGMQRQVFMVELGGFDTHAGQIDKQPLLLTALSRAISSFQQALAFLALTQQVTTFTASDFGRTLTSNGSGTDHGWGSHQFVIGGAVQGGLYGKWPVMLRGGVDDYRSGRLLPTTSLTQVNASLAAWFGASTDEVNILFPNLNLFPSGGVPLFQRVKNKDFV
ncbi:DUF1501 domain-containing protein [Moritella marina ATCC 15381]|uniref:DUF1501 domain-containing protein n=1 Tax=Moritella marina ATCC 15381 TaxID=1202962 RepID=A0A5J6WHU3_MORMI|nr:DUF1501 domain-containing protein [Moritella marina]QFI36731.1 DUF1501 domain-containing protein [Moritella marina ATCC 15381]